MNCPKVKFFNICIIITILFLLFGYRGSAAVSSSSVDETTESQVPSSKTEITEFNYENAADIPENIFIPMYAGVRICLSEEIDVDMSDTDSEIADIEAKNNYDSL